MWKNYYSVKSIEEALQILAEWGERARIVAGATDLILEMERGVRKGIETLVDITRIPDLDRIIIDEEETIHINPLVTHNQCAASKLIVERAFPLAQAAWEVGAPQIRNRGTIAGNVITASPANDTITPLMALGAQVILRSIRGERIIPLQDFYTGVRRIVMQPDEMLVDIAFPALQRNQRGTFMKLGLRRAQAISLVNATVILTYASDVVSVETSTEIVDAKITLGAVAPTIIHARKAEELLKGKKLSRHTIESASNAAQDAATPIDDVRSSSDYRAEMVNVCVARCLRNLADNQERAGFPKHPVLLSGKPVHIQGLERSMLHTQGTQIVTKVNGKEYKLSGGQDKTLLRLIREDIGLTGTKEGCAEGECGACTVFLDGVAVMSCMVPAVRAHGSEIITIEGISSDDQLHPVQRAFVEQGAVQCGYCTPGFIMSAVKLLEEKPLPNLEDIQQAITGNLCRCTGYYKIVQAIERASQLKAASG